MFITDGILKGGYNGWNIERGYNEWNIEGCL
jgi:hypothetical protein